MTLHQTIFVGDKGIEVVRVSGGWIYRMSGNDIFVPYNQEFSATREISQEIEHLTRSNN